MQTLQFEPAWEKTIATKDRIMIEKVFQKEVAPVDAAMFISFLKKAINHQGHLLVTVLIHNQTEVALQLKHTLIAYHEQEQAVATGIFTLPFDIPPHTTMPWTFIFTEQNHTNQAADYIIRP